MESAIKFFDWADRASIQNLDTVANLSIVLASVELEQKICSMLYFKELLMGVNLYQW